MNSINRMKGKFVRKLSVPVATLLPSSARDALVAASRIEDSIERVRTIDRITDRSKVLYPHLFKQE